MTAPGNGYGEQEIPSTPMRPLTFAGNDRWCRRFAHCDPTVVMDIDVIQQQMGEGMGVGLGREEKHMLYKQFSVIS